MNESSIRIKAFANLRSFVPGEIDHPIDCGIAVSDLIATLGIPSGKVAIVMINGHHAQFSDSVFPGDTIALFPPMGGG